MAGAIFRRYGNMMRLLHPSADGSRTGYYVLREREGFKNSHEFNLLCNNLILIFFNAFWAYLG